MRPRHKAAEIENVEETFVNCLGSASMRPRHKAAEIIDSDASDTGESRASMRPRHKAAEIQPNDMRRVPVQSVASMRPRHKAAEIHRAPFPC